jgi:Amt family ammonium transporter
MNISNLKLPSAFANPSSRIKRFLFAGVALAAILLSTGLFSPSIASNGDPSGSKTGTPIEQFGPTSATGSGAVSAPFFKPTNTSKVEIGRITTQQAHDHLAINFSWLMIGGVLVLFMQAGFALVETGFTRAKNAAHTMMMNLVIFAIGAVGWFVCGYALMFGTVSNPGLGITALGSGLNYGPWQILSHSGFLLGGNAYDVGTIAFFFFQLVFMDATATIPTGAMAERFKFQSFIVWGFFCSMLLYPVFGNWVWGGGWLSQLATLKLGHGALDFAGSGVVHAMGGVAAFWGAKAIGPRIGKFTDQGQPRVIPGHHLPMAFLGTMILLVGWMGFNGASTFASTDFRFTVVIVNTILASATGCLAAMFLMWIRYSYPDPSMTANGMLAGLVAITAPCAFVAPWAAAVIGIVAGVLVVIGVEFVEKICKVDDPVGAVAVHGVNGIWGVIALGIFADGTYGDGLNGVSGAVKGILYGDAGQLIAQLIDSAALIVWCSAACIIFFAVIDKTIGLRSARQHELAGLDISEMGAKAYPDFPESENFAN